MPCKEDALGALHALKLESGIESFGLQYVVVSREPRSTSRGMAAQETAATILPPLAAPPKARSDRSGLKS